MDSRTATRVLFLTSASFNKITGGGITFSNLFTQWPIDNIATIHNDPIPTTTDICNRYYVLTEKEIFRWGFLKHIPIGKKPSTLTTGKISDTTRPKPYLRIIRKLKNWVFGDGIPEQVCLTPELENWIQEFQPTVLYTILGSNAMMEMADRIRERFNLPLVVHIMDDWVSVIYRGGLLSFLQRKKKDKLVKKLIDKAAVRLAICDEMAAAYQIRYKQPFLSFQNTVDVSKWKEFEKDPRALGKPVRVAYIGSILPFAQLFSLIDCANAIQSLKAEGFLITLEIFSPVHLAEQYREMLVLGDAITLRDTIADDLEFFRKMQEVDILLLPVNFDKFTIEFIRYSMPTKVPAYLAVGTPVLVYGPSEVAQVSYAIREGWGLVVAEQNISKLKTALKQLAVDIGLRTNLAQRAREVARNKHDATTVRASFQKLLLHVAA